MALFKCKMCGGTLEINSETVATCEYCGTQQTLPKLDNERKENLYDRANHFRRNNEFDKAMGIYEQILNEDTTDSEAYWSLVLCRYGIEYVEDPSSHKRVPTVNRAQFTSVFDDDNYKSALKCADGNQKRIYEEEAKVINEIQKGILAISQNEEPFDVFICYKETDNNGRRTQDSVLANDLYHQLTQEGFKVFFARITLEDKLGSAYEPYIFAALNSAKVMVVLGTKPEFFNAVWVKNEWSRYLALIKNGAKKMLVPAYKDMDPYDLPDEFSHLQAQDMSKLGFMQDLIRGIKKIVLSDVTEQSVIVKETVTSDNVLSVEPLLKRVFMFLEDGNFHDADIYCEKVLDIEPENVKAYLGKLMVEQRVRVQGDLAFCKKVFDNSNNYKKILRFGDEQLIETMGKYIEEINVHNENEKKEGIYLEVVNLMNKARSDNDFKMAAKSFDAVIDYKDAAVLKEKCLEKAESYRKNAIYTSARDYMLGHLYEEAIQQFQSIHGWKDADEQVAMCKQKAEEKKIKEERERIELEKRAAIIREKEKRKKKIQKLCIIVRILLILLFVGIICYKMIKQKPEAYDTAYALKEAGKYEEAIDAFEELGDYKDSETQLASCYVLLYNKAITCINIGNYEEALEAFDILDEKKSNSGSVGYVNLLNTAIDELYMLSFGNYEGASEWIVLDRDGTSLFLLSKKGLEYESYNLNSSTWLTWESCTLREWLNTHFVYEAFEVYERQMILNTSLYNFDNDVYGTPGGKTTSDKVFLLSIEEVATYFKTNDMRMFELTEYAQKRGSTYQWWLRSPGGIHGRVACVAESGAIDWYGIPAGDYDLAIRPAMWIDLSLATLE